MLDHVLSFGQEINLTRLSVCNHKNLLVCFQNVSIEKLEYYEYEARMI